MLELMVPLREDWDEENQMFIQEDFKLRLEHSLVSLSKWESKWCKVFLSKDEKTPEETLDYIKCMTLDEDVPDEVYMRLTAQNVDEINRYIQAPMTATYFSEKKSGRGSGEQVTSELIYYWMVALTIPFECQYWHLNRLITLVQVCNIKNQPPKKMGRKALMSRNAALNQARRAQSGSAG